MPPAKRRIAMVFQSYALYPHMTVRQNIAFSLSIAGASRKEQDERAREVARILQLEPYLDRRPAELSGGQRQRVAIGRALVRKPEVFLFDEPLSNLDAKLRVQMRLELAKLHADLGTTMIYVTHDQTEAMTLADKIVVLDRGTMSQVGSPLELYNHPANKFVAAFIGSPSMNFFAVGVASVAGGGWRPSRCRAVGRRGSACATARAMDAARRTRRAAGAFGDRRRARSDAALTGRVGIVERLGNLTSLYVDTPAGQLIVEGDGTSGGQRPGDLVGLSSTRRRRTCSAPTARRSDATAIERASDGPLRDSVGQPQHDVLIVIAEAAAEDVDAAGMARVGLDLDAQPDRVVAGNVEVAERSAARS